MGGDAERLVVGFSYSMVAGLFSSVFLYVAGLLVIGMLGPENYGLYQLVLLVPGLLAPILNFGIETTLVRFVSKFRVMDADKSIKTARFLLFARATISLSASIVIILLAPWIARLLGESVTAGVRIAGIFLLANMLYRFIQAFFQSFFLMKQRTMVMVIHGVTYLAIVPLLIVFDFGYISPLLAFSLSTFIGLLLGFALAWRRKIYLLPSISRKGVHLSEQLKFAAPTYATLLLNTLFAQAGIILIKFANLEVVQIGYFRAVYNIVAVGSFVAMALNVVIFPYISELESKKDTEMLSYFCSLVIKFLILFGIPASIGIYLIAEPILVILLPQYLEAAILMQILSLMLIFSPIYAVSQTMLIGIGKPTLVLRSSALAMMSVVGIGALLVLMMGTSGIAFSYLLAIMMATVFSLLMLSRSVGLKMEVVFLLKVAVSTVVMALVTFFLIQQMSTSMDQVLVGIPAGAGIYLAMTFVLRTMSSEDYKVIRRTLGIARNKAPSRKQ